jgi:uncharacterized protein (TIGR02001 family)
MKKLNKVMGSTLLATTLSFGVIAPPAVAELASSATLASSYLWRGFELGSGTPVVSADLVYSNSGFYGGVWVSSGDTAAGTEYDLFAGYGGSIGDDFTYDISYVTYVYPTGAFFDTEGQPGDFAEIVLNLGFGPVSFTYKDNVAGDNGGYAFTKDYKYYSLDASVGKFGFALGMHDEGVDLAAVTGDATHFDVTYAATENLSFTVSAIVDSDFASEDEPEPTVVASYSIPLM